MNSTFYAKTIKELDEISKALLEAFGNQKKVVFFGEMGVGKTTLIKSICKALNVQDVVTSPTFSVVNEYHDKKGKPIYHFDFYRVKSVEEIYDLGYEEYFFTNSYCFVEWPEKALGLLPKERIEVKITKDKEARIINLLAHEKK